MSDSYFFGYGSLVNQSTHTFEDAHRARLSGWRRQWRHTDLTPIAFLTVISSTNSAIDGLIAHVPNDDWQALDEREAAYTRVSATSAIMHPVTKPIDIAVYSVSDTHNAPLATRHPILLSYLDVVVQGYFQMFGQEGVDNFFSSTDGWDTTILDDRKAPEYPRHRTLSRRETLMVDTHIDALGMQRS